MVSPGRKPRILRQIFERPLSVNPSSKGLPFGHPASSFRFRTSHFINTLRTTPWQEKGAPKGSFHAL
jgi:hypothetical protein